MKLNAVPQFQGSVTERAPEMPDGCIALAGLASRILGIPVNTVPQSTETSPTESGVANPSVLTAQNLDSQHEAVARITEPILTIGGDCGVEFAPIRELRERHGEGLGVAWFDAHPDLKTPETAHDGAYHAMVLAGLIGEGLMGDGAPLLTATETLDPSKVALIDARGAIAAETAAIERGMGILTDDAATVLRGVTHLYVHVDVDVLDPSEFGGLNMPEPDGLTIPELVAHLEALSGFNVVGAGITECVGTPEQIEVLAPVVTAIGKLLQPTKR